MENEPTDFHAIELPNTDALIICQILDRVIAGKDTSSYGDEARVIVSGLRAQIEARIDRQEPIV